MASARLRVFLFPSFLGGKLGWLEFWAGLRPAPGLVAADPTLARAAGTPCGYVDSLLPGDALELL